MTGGNLKSSNKVSFFRRKTMKFSQYIEAMVNPHQWKIQCCQSFGRKNTVKRPKIIPLIKKLCHIYFFAWCAMGKTKLFLCAKHSTWTIVKLRYNKEKKVSHIFFQRYLGDLLSPAETILVSLLQIAAHLFRTYRTDGFAPSCYIMTARDQ